MASHSAQWGQILAERRALCVATALERMPSTQIRLAALSRELGITSTHLSKTFRRISGTGFREVAVQVRHRHAAELLVTTDLPIKQIAGLVGYKHVSDFSSRFKQVYGMSPTAFRSNAAKNDAHAVHLGPRQ